MLFRSDYTEAHGAKPSEAASTLLRAGLRSLNQEGAAEAAGACQEATGGGERVETHTSDLQAVVDVLRASNADLRLTVSTLTAQLATKDQQIQTAHELVDQAHKLQAAQMQRALPAEGGTSRPSLWERLTGRGRG